MEGAPRPKYYYPTSGSLNPIQAYLEVGEGAVAGLSSAGWWRRGRVCSDRAVRLMGMVMGMEPDPVRQRPEG